MTTRERALLLPDACARCGGEVAWHVLDRRDWPKDAERLVCVACDRKTAPDIGQEIPTLPTPEAPRERMPRWAALLLAVGIAAPFLVLAGLLILLGEGR